MNTLLLIALALANASPAPASPAADTVPVGVATIDITPDFPVRLHGYGSRTAETSAIQERLSARALAIGADDADPGPVLIVTVDNLGVSDAIAADLASRLKAKAGIPRERIAIGASHTHTAPLLEGVAPNIFGKPLTPVEAEHIARYTREFVDKVERVCLEALAARAPGTLAWGQGTVGFAVNRRVFRPDRTVTFGENPDGPVDHSLPMLRVAAPDGAVRVVLVNYACHCTTLDPVENAINADWAGYARAAIEAQHPGAVGMVLIGCGADANPRSRPGVPISKRHGQELADEVDRLLKTDLTPLPAAAPVARYTRVAVPFDPIPTRADFEALAAAGGPKGYNAQTQLARLDQGDSIAESLNYPIQTFQFGDRLLMVFLAGEVVVDYALHLKKDLDPSRLWITSYANDAPCYIPSERILDEGGYEAEGSLVYYAKPTRLKHGIENIIIKTVESLIPPEFAAKAGDGAR